MNNGPTRILVAIDLGPRAGEALREGARLRAASNGTLGVVHVARKLSLHEELVVRNHVGKCLDADTKVDVFVDEGPDAALAIAKRARDFQADVLILGAREQAVLGHVFRGAAEKLVHDPPCPVLVVRPSQIEGAVLAATNLSMPALPAVVAAQREAALRRTHLEIVHAVGFLTAEARYLVTPNEQLATASDFAGFTQELEDAVHEVGVDGACRILSGSPARAIVQEAEASHAQLIVLAKDGSSRDRVSRALVRGVAEEVVSRAPCSVLVVAA